MKQFQPRAWLFPILFVMYEISTYLSNDMYLPALPSMMQDLHITKTHAQLTVTMWFVGASCSPLVMGAIADRFGRRPTLLLGGLIYVIASILCALAINEHTLLAPRILQGAMISSMLVAGYAVIHESYDHRTAIQILAILGGISVLAPALGPLFGAILLSFTNWRAIFWFIALYASITLVLLYRFMPETLPPNKRHALHLSALLNNYRLIIINKKFILLMMILGLTFAGFISWVAAGPLLVINDLHYSKIAFGWIQAGVFGAYFIGSRLVNHLTVRQSADWLINRGLSLLFASGITLVLVATLWPKNLFLFITAIIVYSFGSALCFAPLNRLIIETSDQPMGMRVACFTTGLMLCGAMGSGLASIVYNGTGLSLALMITLQLIPACMLRFFQQTAFK